MRESASRSWNKVLRASLFFAVVCSGGGVGSVSFLVQETVVGEVSCRLPRVTPQWSLRCARRLQNRAGSADITKDAILFSVCRCRSVYVCRGVSVWSLLYVYKSRYYICTQKGRLQKKTAHRKSIKKIFKNVNELLLLFFFLPLVPLSTAPIRSLDSMIY